MKKLLTILLIIVCAISIVSAELELDEIRVYVNNERYYDADKEGGDIDAKKSDTLELIVYLDNNVNTTTQAKLKGVIENIDDGNDITKEQDWYDISANDDKAKTLSFIIPSDAVKDEYDMDLTIYYKYSNGTEYSFSKIEWNIIVEEEKQKEITLNEVVGNMSMTCSQVISKMTESFDYMGKYSGCTENLTGCREERGTYKTQAEENEKTKNVCVIDRDSCKTEIKECENDKTLMVSRNQCDNEKDDAVLINVKEAEKKKDTMMAGIIAIAGAVGLIVWQKRKGLSMHEKFKKQMRQP